MKDTAMSSPLIDLRNVSIGFTGKSGATLPVLRNIDLTVGAGESIGIVGESGSGKSTVALAAMGYDGTVAMEAHASGEPEAALEAFRQAFTV